MWHVFLVAVLTLMTALPVHAQAPEPFSRVAIEVGGVVQVDEAFEGAWESPRGASGSVALPFYQGQVRAAVQLMPYTSTVDGLTNFLGRHAFVEWTLPVEVVPRLRVEGGGRLGVFQMRFEQGTGQQKEEQEVAAFVTAGASYEWRRWAVHVRTAYGTVLLDDPEEQAFVGLGLSRTLVLPEWIQEVLR